MALAETKPAPANAQWGSRGAHVYLAGRAILDGVDHVACEMERKWGIDRLRLLVDADTRLRFDTQRAKLNRAIWHGDLPDIEREGPRMINAWRTLDAMATAVGAEPINPEVWELALPNGTVIAIARNNAEAHAVLSDGRQRQVWTLDEIGRVIEAFPDVIRAKATMPGVTVVSSKPPGDPLDAGNRFSDLVDDEIPF
jgi:hypothetical protein